MNYSFIGLIFLTCCACKSDSKNNLDGTKKESLDKEIDSDSELLSSINCFYVLDDKYADPFSPDSIVMDWLAEKTLDIQLQDVKFDLFTNKGGGINGSEWNPSTDLYIAVQWHQPDYEFWINDSITDLEFIKIESVNWFKIPIEFWEKGLKPIEPSDMKYIFTPIDLAGGQFETYNSEMPLTASEILKIELKCAHDTLRGYFHAAFGE